MTREAVLKKLSEIFQMVFDDEELLIEETTSPEEIEDWDSLEQINLIMQIDKAFGIKFSMDEAAGLYHVGNIVDAIMRKAGDSNEL